mmetsp:Transcript_5822/g.7422  ORF Transcript_5822/g.7422 Transcript_5822/m.7422 type:complete len:683 (+) Transcript_5822:367-2415(+)
MRLLDSLRRKVWPKLVGIDFLRNTISSKPSQSRECEHLSGIDVVDPSALKNKGTKKRVVARCLDADQIDLDIARCTWHLLTGSQRSRRRQIRNKHKKRVASLLKRKQRRLGNFINLVLIQSYADNNGEEFDERRLRYYQGFHDVSCIFLSTLGGTSIPPFKAIQDGEENIVRMHNSLLQPFVASRTAEAMGLHLPSEVLLQISRSHLRDSMKSNFEALTSALRLVVMPLIAKFDPEVHEHLSLCEMEPFFALSWIITWFSHDIRDTSVVKRLFDVFIVSHPMMPVYMSIAMVLHPHNREEVLNVECDFASVHKVLSQLPRNSCSIGWKFIGTQSGGDYVSGDEEDVCHVNMDSDRFFSEDADREHINHDECSTAPSLASESLLSGIDPSRVPFEELIDLSIKLMRRIPPRSLMRLAHKYYGSHIVEQVQASSISLLRPPPDWGLANYAPSDSLSKRSSNRSLKRGSSVTQSKNEGGIVLEAMYPRAAIASGMGPDGEIQSRNRKRRRKRLRMGAVIVGIVAVVCGLAHEKPQSVLGTYSMKLAAKAIMNRMIVRSDGDADSKSIESTMHDVHQGGENGSNASDSVAHAKLLGTMNEPNNVESNERTFTKSQVCMNQMNNIIDEDYSTLVSSDVEDDINGGGGEYVDFEAYVTKVRIQSLKYIQGLVDLARSGLADEAEVVIL